jgi:electron transfer flavoprotein alpha subunit
MSRVLVVAEHDGVTLSSGTAKCVRCALDIQPAAVVVSVFAHGGARVAEQAATLDGVTEVVLIDAPHNREPLAAVIAPQVASLARDFTHVLAPSSTFGKDLLPRAAALLGVGQISDVLAVVAAHRFRRPIHAGTAVVTVTADPKRIVLATVRLASYAAVAAGPAAVIRTLTVEGVVPSHTRLVGRRAGGGARPDLRTANRVVSGGRALGTVRDFQLVAELADALGAALGASRAAVDLGFVANDLQIGQTGKIIAPELYVAVGISGAIQHVTGIKDARTIVAINKDPNAAIFEVADVGLVADLFQAVPELIATLKARGLKTQPRAVSARSPPS